MAMELVTGYAGKAHVTSYQDAAIQAGIVGVDNGVLSYVGQGMKAVATSANNIRIYDGVALIGGKAVVIDRDTYQDVAIANGTVGKYRNDIIYIKYTKDAFTGVESVTFDVKQGAAGNSGIDPALTTNNLYSTGTLTSEIPFKRVRLNGLAIESVENMHDNVPSLTELNRKLNVSAADIISFTPLAGQNYPNWGGCYYYTSGSRVHVHLGIQALPANKVATVFVLPESVHPKTRILNIGPSGSFPGVARIEISLDGGINVTSQDTYAAADIEYDTYS
ncbi:hypothetical protein [[Clostridium] scindens]|uniref:hypothetical protein n=1 Tax=Clostridium scindens (strain JCM 10418 / VPI 12708) TaxID=29347 RepID=UPI00298C760F|nr:hypothetical protein [[Clostridium] scindens]WPB33130.1 hypothetical protein HCEICBPK_01900 [[Clostridium] scindens]